MYLPPHDPQFLLGPQLAVLAESSFEALAQLDPAVRTAGPTHPAPLGRIAAASFAALRVRAAQLKHVAELAGSGCAWFLDGHPVDESSVCAAFRVADLRGQAEARRIGGLIVGARWPRPLPQAGLMTAFLSCMVADHIVRGDSSPGWLVRTAPRSSCDSGWAIYGANEDLDALFDRDGEWPLEVDQLLALAPFLRSLLLYAPIGSQLRWHSEFEQWFFDKPELGDWEPPVDFHPALQQRLLEGQLLPGLLLPAAFGGRLDQDNVTYLPPLGWRAKQEFERALEDRMASGLTTRYTVEAVPGEWPQLPERLRLQAECGGAPVSTEIITRHYRGWGGL